MNIFSFVLQGLVVISATTNLGFASATYEKLDEALLKDLVESYDTYHNSGVCTSSERTVNATTISLDWPGRGPSYWWSGNAHHEQQLFHAIMKHHDATGDRSWEIRIGSGGNIYSHNTPDMYGETMASQTHAGAPWIDEVQQTVSVNLNLNKKTGFGGRFCQYTSNDDNVCKKYYIHEAGAYQRDGDYTGTNPWFSPTLASYCSGDSCYFASWGTQAHVKSPFTSPVMFINKYTNCLNGVIEHTQMVHNFAGYWYWRPAMTDQNWFNVGWGGVRQRSLPIAIEPSQHWSQLHYKNPNFVNVVQNCPWADAVGTKQLYKTGGYTTWVEPGLIVNRTTPAIKPWCKKSWVDCHHQPWNCMHHGCSDYQLSQGWQRVSLYVRPRGGPQCSMNGWNMGLIELRCRMRGYGFGHTRPGAHGNEHCAPWATIQFKNSRTGQTVDIMHVRHWSFNPNNDLAYFTVNKWNKWEAINMVNAAFDNWNNPEALQIEITASTINPEVPADYNPEALSTFTVVYGKGHDHGNLLGGQAQRRIGYAHPDRDLTVYTVNWFSSGAVLRASDTYVNRQYFMSAPLGNVETDARPLKDATFADKIHLEEWNSRVIDLYRSGDYFVAIAANSTQGTTTTCNSSVGATKVCSGQTTPGARREAFIYITCGDVSHFGWDPYKLSPYFNTYDDIKHFPNHGHRFNDWNGPVRPYVCAGQDGIRPTYKLIGWFTHPHHQGCLDLQNAKYNETVCANA